MTTSCRPRKGRGLKKTEEQKDGLEAEVQAWQLLENRRLYRGERQQVRQAVLPAYLHTCVPVYLTIWLADLLKHASTPISKCHRLHHFSQHASLCAVLTDL